MSFRGWLKRLFGRSTLPEPVRPPSSKPHRTQRTWDVEGSLTRLFAEIDEWIHHRNQEKAIACCQRASALLDDVADLQRAPGRKELVASGYFFLGNYFRILGCNREAEDSYQHSLPFWNELASGEEADQTRLRNMAAACLNNLGCIYEATGRLQEAEQAYGHALTIREKLAESHPNDPETRVRLGGTLCNLGNIASHRGQTEKAQELYDQSIRLLENTIPHCECGQQAMLCQVHARASGQPHWITTAQQFLENARQAKGRLLGIS
jgi:tetratricopeptide (TPR) repeat protein